MTNEVKCLDERVTVALIEEDELSSNPIAVQLLKWRYRVLLLPAASLILQRDLLDSAALMITTRSRWEIETILGSSNHPPLLTTNDFDLALRDRIEAYLNPVRQLA